MTPRSQPRPGATRRRWPSVVAGLIVATIAVSLVALVVLTPRVPQKYSLLNQSGLYVGFIAFAATGAVVIARRPTHPVGWLLASVGMLPMVAQPFSLWGQHRLLTVGEPDVFTYFGFWLNSWYWLPLFTIALVAIPLLFPDGRLPSRRWRPTLILPTLTMGMTAVTGMLSPTLEAQDVEGLAIDNPFGIESVPDLEWLGILPAPIFFIAAIAGLVVKYRRADHQVRSQCKLFLLAVVANGIVLFSAPLVPAGFEWLASYALAAIPISIGIAVLRHGLFDIDRLISRTVAYLAITLSMIGLYVSVVIGLGAVARALTGESTDLVVALSTLAVAAAFQPVRRRVQVVVDRRFNRARYDAARTVAAFGARLRDEVDLEALAAELKEVARRTVQPGGTGLWLPDRGGAA